MSRIVRYDWQGNEIEWQVADPVPTTNADRIRGMTDAEIANVLYWADGQGYSRRQWIMWLKSPVEEGER